VLGVWLVTLRQSLRHCSAISFAGLDVQFLNGTGREPLDPYRSTDASWTRLRRGAGLPVVARGEVDDEHVLLRAVRRSLHVDDPERVSFYRSLLGHAEAPKVVDFDGRQKRLLWMLLWGMWGLGRKFDDLDAGLRELWGHNAVLKELGELLAVSTNATKLHAARSLPARSGGAARGSRDLCPEREILAAYGLGSPAVPPQVREGVRSVAA
jgi:hypothetical protein